MNLRIKERVEKNRVITAGSKIQGYINIGVSQISWVTGKIPEFGWTVVLIERFWKTDLTTSWITSFTLGTIFGLFVFGYVWKKSGLFNNQKTTQAKQDPVSEKLLRAAEILIKEDLKCQKKK